MRFVKFITKWMREPKKWRMTIEQLTKTHWFAEMKDTIARESK